MPEREKQLWSEFIVEATIMERTDLPIAVKKRLQKFIDEIGAERMLNLIETCWPDHCDKRPLPIEISGSHLYKQFIWILGSLADKYPQFNKLCDALVVRISELDWRSAALLIGARPFRNLMAKKCSN